ncbi:eCIS core domain-containing protein [Haliangium sp.]|uniref:eCIS core domain-containing protein n=1 Tax=Haliangium sp. TaxID=2663208 RepID=UPI003D124137
MTREREGRPSAQERTGSAEHSKSGRASPGKVTRTARLATRDVGPVQAKASSASPGGQPPVKTAWQWTNDPWMDAAHRGVVPAGLAVQAKAAFHIAGAPRRGGSGEARADHRSTDGSARSTAPVQAKAGMDAEASDYTHRAAAAGVSGSGGALPHLERIQQSFGPDFALDHVQAHVGGAAAEASDAIGAAAYATGDRVGFRSTPDVHTAAHEAAHIIQQQRGVQLRGGVGQVGDAYERHADAVADRVVAGQSATELLAIGPAGGDHSALAAAPGAAGSGSVQRTLHYDAIAERIHEAIDGLGTDEEAVYLALQPVRGNADAINRLKDAYETKYGETLEDAIRGDFSGTELQHCLDLLNSGAAAAPTGDVHEAAAEQIHDAVDGAGTDEEAIFAALEPFGRNTTETTAVRDAYQSRYNEDLLVRLADELSGSELEYAMHLMGGGASMNTETLMEELGDMEGDSMTWIPSAPGQADLGPPNGVVALGRTDFAAWALAATEAAAPAVTAVTTINCWEMILLAAYNSGILSWQRIHDTYTAMIPASTVAKLQDPDPVVQAEGSTELSAFIDDLLYALMTSGAPTVFDKNDPATPMPSRGDVVFFDGAAHVALATGNGDEIYTFWPPPNTAFTSGGTVDAVKTSTITELDDWMEVNFGASPHVTFYAPAW